MLTCVVEVQVHLAGICVCKLSELQINDEQATEPAMKEHQVDSIPLIANTQPLLPSYESEVVPEFEGETLPGGESNLLRGRILSIRL